MKKWLMAAVIIAAAPATANAQDAAAGEATFNKCKACHALDKNGVGPSLGGIMGKKIASTEGYNYSPALTKKAAEAGTWTDENMTAWLSGPGAFAPGTKMAFKINADLVPDLIAFLKTK